MNHRSRVPIHFGPRMLERYVIVQFISWFIQVDSENRMFHQATAAFLSSPLPPRCTCLIPSNFGSNKIYPCQYIYIYTSLCNFTYTSVKISEMKTKIRMRKNRTS
ncbi:hypothetical protein EUGRSUZ_B03583 [Eucalyptus grandis]|uniref:Uncharacterized protein n=2 Tax=Eucalyptus grandis TaxID=71139 RepID=A0ACC3LWY9_EUCGR|nr:hypothetical protein EUGRSUZ_B03583 [Eucalyptus grandis]